MKVYIIHYLDFSDSDTGHNKYPVSIIDTVYLEESDAKKRYDYLEKLKYRPHLEIRNVL